MCRKCDPLREVSKYKLIYGKAGEILLCENWGECEVWVVNSGALVSVSPPHHTVHPTKQVTMCFVP